jgi:hypothetical protein
MTIAVTVDRRWGGFYAGNGYAFRLCLGFIAIDFFPDSMELMLHQLLDNRKEVIHGSKSATDETDNVL